MANYQKYQATVESSKEVTKRIWVTKFKLSEPSKMEFLAGQYCSFKISDSVRRTFSITTPPSQTDSFEVCADITPMGPGSKMLVNAKPGDIVEFVGPLGKFIIDRESLRQPVFIATGTGIAPIRSMIYEFLESEVRSKKQEATLFWGVRYEEDIFWNEEFMKLEDQHQHFQYYLTLSQPTDTWKGRKGYVTDHLNHLKDLAKHDFYLCGNRVTIDSIRELLVHRGVPSEQVKMELFF
jgi:NAD(P)H-flavin reductase